ncbi:FKBP-type peptidyl-prolyl cis-trans isomerase [Flavobacteriaceae bacterium R38]|nr:FKBP-type peptidyl-prolyl cis-trans isomerase [Flavobacteriaceae bacterium R38]
MIRLSTGKKKNKSIPLSASATLADLISISQNKKLKISATDILFIQEGLKEWAVESRKLGHEYTDSGLGIKVIKESDGEFPEKGKRVRVHYIGYLEDGTKFDSSVDRNEPFSFPLGQERVIKGWDEGVSKLRIGSKAILKIPADLGYGARGAGGVIPPNATLYFEIEVLGVE